MEVLVEAFRKHLNKEKIKYEEIIERFPKNSALYDKNALYKEEINVEKSFKSKIKSGIIIRKINAKNSEIINKINSKFSILYEKIYCEGNVNYTLKGKVNEFYHYLELINLENSNSNAEIRLFTKGYTVVIGKVVAFETSKNSSGNLKMLFLPSKKANIVSIPILDIRNDTSKGFHSTKIIKLDEDQILFLRSKGLEERKIKSLVYKSFFL
ncbi:MAG: SufD family Fe-S cluster assembly protein [Candidatus Aenigmatarchaeota archaeon]